MVSCRDQKSKQDILFAQPFCKDQVKSIPGIRSWIGLSFKNIEAHKTPAPSGIAINDFRKIVAK